MYFISRNQEYLNDIRPPRRTTFIGIDDCDFCGVCKKHGEQHSNMFTIEPLLGWLYCECEHCKTLFQKSKETFYKDMKGVFLTPENLKVTRTSGINDDGWYIPNFAAVRFSVDHAFRIRVEKIVNEVVITKEVQVDELLLMNAISD